VVPLGFGVIVVDKPMRMRLWLVVALMCAVTVPALADRRSDAKVEVDFGITCAQKGLWPRAVQQFV